MIKKWMLALAVLGMSIASAKTFTINLASPSTAGKVQLQPGDYKLKIEPSANKAVFTSVATGKSYETNVKVENASEKYAYTAVETKKTSGGVNQIDEIQLQGTRMKLEFE